MIGYRLQNEFCLCKYDGTSRESSLNVNGTERVNQERNKSENRLLFRG